MLASLNTHTIAMILSRTKPASAEGSKKYTSKSEIPKLEEFIKKRDYVGAVTLLEFMESSSSSSSFSSFSNPLEAEIDLWIAYCYFHLGDHRKAATLYENLKKKDRPTNLPDLLTYLACCYFFLGMYSEAKRVLLQVPESSLKTRILFHLCHKMSDDDKLKEYHTKLEDVVEDQLSLASIHYLRAHYQQAIDIYKKVLLNNRDYFALNVYVALCYYKLDYYDAAQEVLQVYLQRYPDSAIAVNLKACNHFRLYNGKAAQAEMKKLTEQLAGSCNFGNDLIQHNMVVFRGGEGALQVLPNLVDVIPEARLNLVLYYLRQDEIHDAYELIKDLEPTVPQEYILKGIVNAIIGQETGSRENIKIAEQYFHLVGSSTSECDTIPGRQSMSSCFFLYRQFEEVLVYLNSIKTYFSNEDNFNMNYAQAQTAAGYYKEAEEAFLAVRNEKYKNDYTYISFLVYCYIMHKKSQLAWELYLKMDTCTESFNLLQLIANTCYKVGEFWYATKAFDMLERMDPTPENWEGKRGASCGTFQYIVGKKLPKELLKEIIQLLGNTSNSQAEQIIRVMRKWGKDNQIAC